MRIALGAGLLLVLASGALAADFPAVGGYYAPPAPITGYTWYGPYAGATIGYEWGDVSNNPTKPSGVTGGLEAGYSWQRGNVIFGGEADLQVSAAKDTLAPWQFANAWYGTVRARGGLAAGNMLFYGTAGLAYGRLRAEAFGLSEAKTSIGWVAGAGVEVGFAPRWSAKAELLYLDFADRNYMLTGTENGLAAYLMRLGVNYRF